MSILEVHGARLYYETYGSGPVMLMIPGASGSADSFQRVTPIWRRTTRLSSTIAAVFPGVNSMDPRTTIIGSKLTPMMSGA